MIRGYEFFYEENPLWEEPMTKEESLEVLDILDMYHAFEIAHPKASQKLNESNATFEGFDGNNETKQMGFVNFWMDEQCKYHTLKSYPRNSHMRKLPFCRAMLVIWRQYPNQYELSIRGIKDILKKATESFNTM